MRLFTLEENKKLAALLDKAADPDDTLTLDALHGFLFGLAIIPEPVMPSEWLPIVFGDQMLEADSAEEVQTLLAPLFAAYNRIMAIQNRGKLAFPFDMGKLKQDELEQIEEWTNGLYCALHLRPDIWDMGSDEDEALPDEEEEILAAFGIIMGIAMPDEVPNLFQSVKMMTEADETRRTALLYAMLPQAVRTVQEYAEKRRLCMPVEEEWMEEDGQRRSIKIGRNDPCPCGSGKKYKKCCGRN